MTGVSLRDLDGMAEFRAAEDLQRAVWGATDIVDPADLMFVIQAEGGLVAGAFREDRLLGYVFGFPTVTPGVQHSHRLAVLEEARGLGLGAALKWYQRDWCRARAIAHVRWTFDPLRHANAALNIARLGAQVSRYFPDYYGAMEGINKGAPSDRLLADWFLESPGVVARAAGQAVTPPEGARRITIPADFGALLTGDPATALAERLRVRGEMRALLDRGLAVTGYDPASRAYLLTPPVTSPDRTP